MSSSQKPPNKQSPDSVESFHIVQAQAQENYQFPQAQPKTQENKQSLQNNNNNISNQSTDQQSTTRSQVPLMDVKFVESEFQPKQQLHVQDQQPVVNFMTGNNKLLESEYAILPPTTTATSNSHHINNIMNNSGDIIDEHKLSAELQIVVSQNQQMKKQNQMFFHMNDDDDDDDNDYDGYNINAIERQGYFDALNGALEGSFKPLLLLIKNQCISVQQIVEEQSGYRPIHLVSFFGKLTPLRVLVTRLGADLNSIDAQGQTALHLAALNGEMEILRYLAAFAHSNIKSQQQQMVSISVNHPIQIQLRDRLGFTPLLNAIKGGKTVAFLFLYFEKNADLFAKDQNGNTVLHIAAFNNSESILELLLSHTKVDINAQDKYDATPLMRAIYSKSYNAVKKLLIFKPDMTIPNERGICPKQYAMRFCESNDAMMKKILEQLEKYQINEAVQEIDSFEGFKEQIRNTISCSCCCCCCLSKSRGGMFCRMLCKRGFYGKNAAMIQYILLMVFMWLYGYYVLGIFKIMSAWGLIYNVAIVFNLIALIVCIFSAKRFEKSLALEKISFFERTPSNIIHSILKRLEEGRYSQIPPDDRICFSCLTIKKQHSHHCKVCGRCVTKYHKHSKWMNSCIGEHNARSYYCWTLLNFFLVAVFFTSFFYFQSSKQYSKYRSQHLLHLFDLTIQRGFGVNLVVFLLSFAILMKSAMELLLINQAVLNDMTIREIKKMWVDKYNYKLETDEKSENSYFILRRVYLCGAICNFFKFLKGEKKVRKSWNSARDLYDTSSRQRGRLNTIEKIDLELGERGGRMNEDDDDIEEQGISQSPMFDRNGIDFSFKENIERRDMEAMPYNNNNNNNNNNNTKNKYFSQTEEDLHFSASKQSRVKSMGGDTGKYFELSPNS